MRFAYLILAHDNPAHLCRLVDAIREDWTDIFVHVDKKADISQFTSVIDSSRVRFIPQRVSACWGGFSLVQATLNLMAAARCSTPSPDRYILISGADYPIRSNNRIYEFLSASKNEHINIVEMSNPEMYKPISWIETFQFEGARGRPMLKRVVLHQTNRLLEKYYKRDYRRALDGMKPYAGSQWWALSREAVEYVLTYTRDNPRFVRFFRHTVIPDEIFIQTILVNSHFRRKVARNFTYTDFSGGHSGPAVLSEDHLRLFADKSYRLDNPAGVGPCFFARKFSPANARLLDAIDEIRASI